MHEHVSEESISELVEAFYNRIRVDMLLGPIFAEAIGADWEPHLAKMKVFWATVLLTSKTYKGNPMLAHLQLPRLNARHFDHWLQLWRETADGLCTGNVASVFVQKAQAIGERLLCAISIHHQSTQRGAT